MVTPANNRKIAIALAFAGSLPTPLPLAWLHKFYLGHYLWGIAYLVLFPTGLPAVACCIEGVWYLTQSDESFMARFPQAGALLPNQAIAVADSMAAGSKTTADSKAMQAAQQQAATAEAAQQVAAALRDLDRLRQEGLMTEYEFEQKRRKLLAEIS